MRDSKLIQIISTFSVKEMKEFEKFVKSPYFTTGLKVGPTVLLNFFRTIKKNYPLFKNKLFNKENIYKELYPDKKYKDEVMRVLMSVMTNLAEDFLSYSLSKNDFLENKRNLLISLDSRKLDSFFEHHKKITENFLQSNKYNINYFSKKYILQEIANDFYNNRKKPVNIQDAVNNFFYFFITKSLGLYRNMTLDGIILNRKFDFIFFNEVLGFLKLNPEILNKYPLISLYYYELLLTTSPHEIYFNKLKEFKQKYINNLDIVEQYEVYVCLTSFCIKMYDERGLLEYRLENFNLYKEILEKNIHRLTAFIPLYFFLSVVLNSCYLKEFTWAEKFIKQYKNKLDPLHRDYAENYSMATLYFSKRKYNSALEHLSKINIEFSQQKQQLKNLMLKIYYETGLYDEALYLIDTSKHFLKRAEGLPENTRISYTNFIKYFHELLKLKINAEYSGLQKLKNMLNNYVYFSNKEWLMEKIEELLRIK